MLKTEAASRRGSGRIGSARHRNGGQGGLKHREGRATAAQSMEELNFQQSHKRQCDSGNVEESIKTHMKDKLGSTPFSQM